MGQESLVRPFGLTNQVSPLYTGNEILFTNSNITTTSTNVTNNNNNNSCNNERHEHVSPISLIERVLLVSFTSGLLSATVAVTSINRTMFMTFYPTGSLLMSTVFALGNRRNFGKRITLISLISFVATSLAMMTLGFTGVGSWKARILTIGLSIQIIITMAHAFMSVH